MNESQLNSDKLLNTTDCLEAVNVFKAWKNFLFTVLVICLILLQLCFVLAKMGNLQTDGKSRLPAFLTGNQPKNDAVSVDADSKEAASEPNKSAVKSLAEPNVPLHAFVSAANEPNNALPAHPGKREFALNMIKISDQNLTWIIRLLNFILIPASALYCLAMLFSLKISLLARLGGINHIARAFFLSLVVFILILPWQRLFGDFVIGLVYSPAELFDSVKAAKSADIFNTVLHYLRFCGYWILVLLILVCAQARSAKWAKKTLRRLEVI